MSHVYCCSDLHGQEGLWGMVKDIVYADDSFCYILGDCVDRGPAGFKILKEVLEDTKHFALICGNHEQMFMESMKAKHCTRIHMFNGGEPTVKAWEEDGSDKKYIEILDQLPKWLRYDNKNSEVVILSHSGFTPGPQLGLPEFDDDFIWNREHFDDDWDEEGGMNNVVLVHGHTPVPLLSHYCYEYMIDKSGKRPSPGAYFYCKDSKGKAHKINIDGGCFFTGSLPLIDLDTWEQNVLFDADSVFED